MQTAAFNMPLLIIWWSCESICPDPKTTHAWIALKTLGEYFVILTKEKKSPYIVTNNVKLIIHQEIDKIFSRTGKKTSGSVSRLPLNKTSKKACAVKQAKMTVKKILFSSTETRLLSKRLQLHGINFFFFVAPSGRDRTNQVFFFQDLLALFFLISFVFIPWVVHSSSQEKPSVGDPYGLQIQPIPVPGPYSLIWSYF